MTSKRQQNSGFILPDPVTGYDTICVSLQIPNVREYRAAFVGHLYKLANWWTWEKSYSASDQRAKQAADMWRRLIYDTLQISDCESGGTPVSSSCAHYIGDIFSNISATPPPGCLAMDGTTHQQADYADLVPLLPASWKDDNAGTFTLPATPGANVVGVGFTEYPPNQASYTVTAGMTGGETRHTLTEDELASHSHIIPLSASQSAGDLLSKGSLRATPMFTGNSTSVVGSDAPHNNMSPYVAAYWYIQATLCQEESQGDFDIRLSGCLLEYTLNGSMWFVVNGWTDYDNCLDIPLPFDLRFNNCVLEYSRDSAQTWDTVPGWNDVAACFPDSWTPEDHSIRVQDGVLQYTEDGGETWNNVFGWNTLQDNFLREHDRCLNAWGAQFGLRKMLLRYVARLEFSYTTESEFANAVLDEWQVDFPDIDPPDQLEAFISFCWNVPDHHDLWAEFFMATPTTNELAQYIYSALPAGEWCAINDVTAFLTCEMPEWVRASLLFLEATAYFSIDDEIEWRAELYRMMDYGTCYECQTLEVIEPCPEFWHKNLITADIISTDGWVLVFGYDTPSGLISQYASGNAIASCRLQRQFPALGGGLTIEVDWTGVTNPQYRVTCDVDGVFTTLASGNTATATIEATIPPGVIQVLQIETKGLNTDDEMIIITRVDTYGLGECPFTACD